MAKKSQNSTKSKRSENVIYIKCRGAGTLPIEQLSPTQGKLKILLEENYQKLKAEMIQDGFIEPVSIWENPKDGKVYVINGHQRLETLKRMKADGWTVPPIPVNFVEADDLEHARRLVLPLTSQYGTINPEAAFDYVSELGLDADHLKTYLNFADFDMDRFLKEYFPEEEAEEPESEKPDGSGVAIGEGNLPPKDAPSTEIKEGDFEFAHKCPRCNFEFD